jgi:hypothetical protein
MMNLGAAQFRLTSLLCIIACVAVNLWLFRVGAIWGILGLNVTKHVVIASLCQRLGIDHASERNAGRANNSKPDAPGIKVDSAVTAAV